MKQILFFLLLSVSFNSFTQSFNDEKVALSNFLKRMYINNPFEGVKAIEDYDRKYLISVVSLEIAKYTNQSTMIRVSQTKAQSQASRFFNGSQITSDFIIKTIESDPNDSTSTSTIIETIEEIKENSIGFVNELELLTNFNIENDMKMLFIYFKELKKN